MAAAGSTASLCGGLYSLLMLALLGDHLALQQLRRNSRKPARAVDCVALSHTQTHSLPLLPLSFHVYRFRGSEYDVPQ